MYVKLKINKQKKKQKVSYDEESQNDARKMIIKKKIRKISNDPHRMNWKNKNLRIN